MPVNITNEELDLFNKNGFSDDDVRATVTNYRNQGLDDNAIRTRINERLNSWATPQSNNTPVLETGIEKNYTQNWDKKGRVYYTDESGNKVNPDKDLSAFQKVGRKLQATANNFSDWLQETNPESKAYKQKANVILTAETLPMGIGKTATQAIATRLTPVLSEKIAQGAAHGLGGGLVAGGVFGGGDALIEGRNPIPSALLGSALGALGGFGLGAGGSFIGGKIANLLNKPKTTAPITDATTEAITNVKSAKQAQKQILGDIGDMVEKPTPLEYVTNHYKNRFVKTDVSDEITRGMHDADIELNNILKEIKSNPGIVNDAAKINELENRLLNATSFPYEELNTQYFDKFYKALSHADEYNKLTDRMYLSGYSKEPSSQAPQYFGSKVEKTQPLGVETKKTKLTQTMKDKGTLPDELQGINPEYEVLHNAEISAQATEALNKDPNKVLGELQQKAFNKDAELSALDFETARQTVSKLYQEGRIEEALALTEQISQKASKAGQSVQALSLWSKTTPEGAVRYAQKVISDYNKNAKKKLPLLNETQANEIMELAKNVQFTDIGTRENDIANQLLLKYIKDLVPVSAGAKLRTVQNISLLLNAKTFLRNIGGNAIFAGMENLITKPIAAGLDRLASLKTGVRTRVMPKLSEYVKGMGKGFKEGAEDVKLGINTRDKLGTRFNLNNKPSFENKPFLNKVEKALNYSLQVPDRAFYQAAYNESLANQMAAAKVLKPTSEMIEQATQDALESVYQNNSGLGRMALKLRGAANELGNINGYGLGDAFIPYAQTPANIAQQGINYSPLGFVKGINNARLGNQRQATLDLARAITGSGLMGVGAYGAYKGVINPALEDYRERKNYEALGLRPDTVNIGDYNVSFNQLQPLSQPLLSGASLYDIKKGDYKKALDRSMNAISDLSMLQTTNKFMSDLQDDGIATATANLVSSVPSRFVPTALKQINDLIDNTQRDTSDANILKQGINQAIAKVPGLSRVLPEKYDITGQPMQKYQTKGLARVLDATVNPVFVNKRQNDETLNRLIDLYETEGDKSALLPLADKKVTYRNLKGEQVTKQLNAKERNMYQQQLGVVNKQVLDHIVNTDFFNQLDNENKINFINTAQRYIKGYVDENLWGKPSTQKRNLIKQLTGDAKDEIMRDILRMYKNEILPAQVENIYQQNFR